MKTTLKKELQQFYQTLCEVEKLGGLKKSDKERFGKLYKQINECYLSIAHRREQADMGIKMGKEQNDPKLENSYYQEYSGLCNIMRPMLKIVDMLDYLLKTATD